jgi:UDP-N-acetylmuramate--alanine ligase
VFQPHQYSRTVKLFYGFVSALLCADYVFITDIYRQRDSDSELEKVKSQDLVDALKKRSKTISVGYAEDRDKIVSLLLNIMDEKIVVVFMGAGDINDIACSFSATLPSD